jgi:hypothetical protein
MQDKASGLIGSGVCMKLRRIPEQGELSINMEIPPDEIAQNAMPNVLISNNYLMKLGSSAMMARPFPLAVNGLIRDRMPQGRLPVD